MTPPATKKIWAGKTIRVSRVVSSRVDGSNLGNCSAVSAGACHHRTTVATVAIAARVPSTTASRSSAAASSPPARRLV